MILRNTTFPKAIQAPLNLFKSFPESNTRRGKRKYIHITLLELGNELVNRQKRKNVSKNAKISITLQEFDFLRAYVDIESPTFGNAYQSALKAGYSQSYCRVVRRNYPLWRMKWLKMALKDDGLVKMIEAMRNIDFGAFMPGERKLKQIIRKCERELIGMSAKEVISALDELLGKSI